MGAISGTSNFKIISISLKVLVSISLVTLFVSLMISSRTTFCTFLRQKNVLYRPAEEKIRIISGERVGQGMLFRPYPGAPYVVAARVVARHFLLLSDACTKVLQLCESVLHGSGEPYKIWVEHGCRISALPVTERLQLCSSRKKSLIKMGRNSAV
jgi:hypothetical protein